MRKPQSSDTAPIIFLLTAGVGFSNQGHRTNNFKVPKTRLLEVLHSFTVTNQRTFNMEDETSQSDDDLFNELMWEYISEDDEFDSLLHPPEKKRRVRRVNIFRDFKNGHLRIFNDYFSPNPVFGPKLFRRRFRMSKPLFQRICSEVKANDDFFVQRNDATGFPGASSLQKFTAAIRMLAYGCSSDSLDEYLRMSETLIWKCFARFCLGVVQCFGEVYLRQPTEEDVRRQLAENKKRGFPGMFGSIDCMNWKWKNCPTAWR